MVDNKPGPPRARCRSRPARPAPGRSLSPGRRALGTDVPSVMPGFSGAVPRNAGRTGRRPRASGPTRTGRRRTHERCGCRPRSRVSRLVSCPRASHWNWRAGCRAGADLILDVRRVGPVVRRGSSRSTVGAPAPCTWAGRSFAGRGGRCARCRVEGAGQDQHPVADRPHRPAGGPELGHLLLRRAAEVLAHPRGVAARRTSPSNTAGRQRRTSAGCERPGPTPARVEFRGSVRRRACRTPPRQQPRVRREAPMLGATTTPWPARVSRRHGTATSVTSTFAVRQCKQRSGSPGASDAPRGRGPQPVPDRGFLGGELGQGVGLQALVGDHRPAADRPGRRCRRPGAPRPGSVRPAGASRDRPPPRRSPRRSRPGRRPTSRGRRRLRRRSARRRRRPPPPRGPCARGPPARTLVFGPWASPPCRSAVVGPW